MIVCRTYVANIRNMIKRIASAVVYVSDQDEALKFYRDVLDFEVIMDAPMGESSRWLEIKPRGGETSIVLAQASAFGRQPGEGAFLTFACDDVAETVKQLRARGATTSEVNHEPWGTYATVDAPDGHKVQFNSRPQN